MRAPKMARLLTCGPDWQCDHASGFDEWRRFCLSYAVYRLSDKLRLQALIARLDMRVLFTELKPVGAILRLELLADHDRAVTAGIVDSLFGRRHEGAPHDVNAGLLIVVDNWPAMGWRARGQCRHRAGRPSSTAARVALSASSTRSFFSFTSTSVTPADADEFNQLRETDGPP